MTKVNINTIAKEANVSTTTVSNYINGTEVFPISRENRLKIGRVMRELNYRPHLGGSMMSRKGRRPRKLGFICGEHVTPDAFAVVHLPQIGEIFTTLSAALVKAGWKLEILSIHDENACRDWNEALLDVDFVVNFGQLHTIMVDTLQRRNVPFLELAPAGECRIRGEWLCEPPTFDFVHWRHDRQMAAQVGRFYDEGARRFAYLSSWNVRANRPEHYALDAEAKITGFREGVDARPGASGAVLVPPMPSNCEVTYEFALARRLVAENAELLAGVDAVLCHNDIVAYGALSEWRETAGLRDRTPRISGEGDFPMFRHWHPKVATSRVDFDELTRTIIGIVREHDNGPPDRPARRIELSTVPV